MKKSLIIFFIAISLSGLLTPAVSRAQEDEMAPIFSNKTASTSENMNSDDQSECAWNHPGACLDDFLYSLLDTIGNAILSACAWILWACGVIFNLSIITFVIHMKSVMDGIPAIYVVWQTVRDLANMFFIFILLYIAIATILDSDTGYKKMLIRVVLVALFINFSFFFTGAMIDASNIVALQFYNGFAGGDCGDSKTKTGALNPNSKADGCMSQKIVTNIKLGSIYKVDSNGQTTKESVVLSSRQGVTAFFITMIFGSILMIVIGGIFITSAILILYRFVELIIVLMFSPIAFAALALPAAKKYWDEWWNKLTKQLIFAPAYFMFLWVTMKVIQSDALKIGNDTGMAWTNGFGGDEQAIFFLIANYIIVIMMLGYSLKLAVKLGAEGTDTAKKWSKGFAASNIRGFLGRNIVGKAAYSTANSKIMRGIIASHPTLSKVLYKPLDSLGKQKFGGEIGYDEALENRKKSQIELGKRVGETGLLVRHKGESGDDFKKRQQKAEITSKERKAKFTEIIGGYDNSITTKLSNKLGITAALRSNKEAYVDMSKQIDKDTKEKEGKEERNEELQKTLNALHKLQGDTKKEGGMGHVVTTPLVPGKAKKENLATEAEEERVKEQEVKDLGQIEAEIISMQAGISATRTKMASIDTTDEKAMGDATINLDANVKSMGEKIAEKRKIEQNRRDFDALKNKANNLQDRIDRDNEATKISTAAGKSTPPPVAPKTT
jgi:hypothetical protein